MKKTGLILYNNPLLLFLLFLFIAYLPVFWPFFHLKNDLITQNLPTRFVISESIYSGYFPWWNPYIHFGIPQYGDMNNGFWNPFIWIISKTVGYNIWTITAEEMFYILLGGWGIYKVCREFISKEISIITGMSYMAGGYIIGHLQHFCWITGTAFFPYVLLFFIRVNKLPAVKNFILGSFAIFFFLSATHPGLIIGALYFFLFLVLFIFIHRKNHTKILYGPKFWMTNFLFIVSGLAITLVIIVSNIDALQHISRGQKLSLEQMLLNPTTFQSYLSLFVPLAVHKSFFWATDISMRNVYIGLAGITGLGVFFKHQKKKIILSVVLPLLFFILLSAGSVFKILFSKIFPLVGFVRMNGEFTYFASLILILAGAAGLESISKINNRLIYRDKFLNLLQWGFICTGILSLGYILVNEKNSFFNQFYSLQPGLRKVIKYLIEKIPLSYLLLIDCLLQTITIAAIKKYIANKPAVTVFLTLNLIIHCWLILPYTGLGMRSPGEFNSSVNIFEKGIHAPELTSIRNTHYLDSSMLEDVWLISSYSKKIGYTTEESYPVQLRNSVNFFSDHLLFQYIINQSYLFLSNDTTINTATSFDSAYIRVLSFGPGYIKAAISNSKSYNYITLLQNDYPYWKVKTNGKYINHFTAFKTFITADLPKGNSTIEFIFEPFPVKSALWISISLIVIACFILSNKTWRNKQLFM